MIPKSVTTLEGVKAAADPTLFLELNADGTVNWETTRAYLAVYCNKTRGVGEGQKTYSDPFQVSISGQRNITTVACHIQKGKNIDRIQCNLSVELGGVIGKRADGTPKLKADGTTVFENVLHLHMVNIELGQDSKTIMETKLNAKLDALVAQGTLLPTFNEERPAVMAAVSGAISEKSKNTPFDMVAAKKAGKYGNMRIYTGGAKAEGGAFWTAQDSGQVTPINTDPALGVLANATPAQQAILAKALEDMKAAEAGGRDDGAETAF